MRCLPRHDCFSTDSMGIDWIWVSTQWTAGYGVGAVPSVFSVARQRGCFGCCRLSDRPRLLASLDNDSEPGSEANGTTDIGG